ncbi:uncharacterized protein LOC126819509 [Patella vulgata]|uniref:uncharacterized protein LOC126819509 n=1 Tax=Patella vulgata TaxID=6465 RepID=UPI00218050F7|nr:uncharacterized protein LOC126819509 [Patella vulgata]
MGIIMSLRRYFKCYPYGRRFSYSKSLKIFTVLLALTLLILFYPKEQKPKTEKHKGAWYDFIDPDVLKRDPGLKGFRAPAKEIVKPNVYTNNKDPQFNHTCVSLKVGKTKTPICVYDSKMDSMISAALVTHSTWEAEHLEAMETLFKRNKSIALVDLGCNIGVYTIFAAKLGRKVIAVDPVESNLQLLDKSLKLGKLRDKVTLVHNAVSDNHDKVSIDLRIGNIGGSHVKLYKGEKPLKRVKRFKRIHNIHKSKRSPIIRKQPAPSRTKVGQVNPKKKNPLIFHPQKKNIQNSLQGKQIKPQLQTRQPNKLQNGGGPRPSPRPSPRPIIHTKTTRNPPLFNEINKRNGSQIVKNIGNKDFNKNKVHINSRTKGHEFIKRQNGAPVQAITVDDLLQLGRFPLTYLKMDIEGWEERVLNSAMEFLHAFKVKYVFMEWIFHRFNPSASRMVDFMVSYGYLPHKYEGHQTFRDLMSSKGWPDNIYWIKR